MGNFTVRIGVTGYRFFFKYFNFYIYGAASIHKKYDLVTYKVRTIALSLSVDALLDRHTCTANLQGQFVALTLACSHDLIPRLVFL